jgi:O-antigen/teichoic acid export membrane protein
MIGQSLCTKLLSIFGQVALAYILLPEDFAAISLAYTVSAFARILESAGLREVLVHRDSDFENWSSSVFWLSLLLGSLSSLFMLISARFAADVYQSELVEYLLILLAITPVVASLSVVPLASLQSSHRFRALACLAALFSSTQSISTVVFSLFGWGAYSFVFGTILSSLLNTSFAWHLARPLIDRRLELRKWKALFADSISLTLSGLATTILQQVDYVMLGIFQPKEQVGYYFFAFGIATQTTQILSANVATVFLPVFCKMQSDPVRQLSASFNAFQILAAIGIPISFLQCGMTDAGFELFFPRKWSPAIPYTQILSLGLGLNLLTGLCWSLLKSQGRFRTILYLNTVTAILFSLFVAVAAIWGTPLTVSICVVIFCAVYSPVVMRLAVQPIGGSWMTVFHSLFAPIALSAISLVAAWSIEGASKELGFVPLVRLLVVFSSFSVVYLGGLVALKHPLSVTVIEWVQGRYLSRSSYS